MSKGTEQERPTGQALECECGSVQKAASQKDSEGLLPRKPSLLNTVQALSIGEWDWVS